MELSRRRFTEIVGVGSVLLHIRYLVAQESSANVSEAIEENRDEAETLLEAVTEYAPDMNNDAAEVFIRRETTLRTELQQILAGVPSDELSSYVLPNRQGLAESLENADLPLLPDEQDIQAQVVPSEEQPTECDDSVLSVCLDIFLEGLDLQEIGTALKKVVADTPEIRENIDALAQELWKGNWEQVVDLILLIMDKLSLIGFGDLLSRVLGEKNGRKVWIRILKKLRSRFVPFVGQLYTAISIAVAVFNHRGRLVHAIECADVSRYDQRPQRTV